MAKVLCNGKEIRGCDSIFVKQQRERMYIVTVNGLEAIYHECRIFTDDGCTYGVETLRAGFDVLPELYHAALRQEKQVGDIILEKIIPATQKFDESSVFPNLVIDIHPKRPKVFEVVNDAPEVFNLSKFLNLSNLLPLLFYGRGCKRNAEEKTDPGDNHGSPRGSETAAQGDLCKTENPADDLKADE